MPSLRTGSLAEALNDVRRSAQQLLADVDSQPRALRIRAGEVQVELEWPTHHRPGGLRRGAGTRRRG